ncbi:MAG: RNA polymerase sigma factor [Candidatus Gracilibacteria bacterium]
MEQKDLKMQEPEINILVQKAQTGDTEAFAKLYDIFIQPVYRYVYYKVRKDDALDLTESVFLKVWEHLKSYSKLKGAFSSWVFKIAHNVVVDHYRLQREHVDIDAIDLPDENRESDPKFITENRLNQDLLRQALSKLKKKYQDVLVLRYINGLEHREIARIMRRSEGSLRILKFRALQSLKKIMEDMNIQM